MNLNDHTFSKCSKNIFPSSYTIWYILATQNSLSRTDEILFCVFHFHTFYSSQILFTSLLLFAWWELKVCEQALHKLPYLLSIRIKCKVQSGLAWPNRLNKRHERQGRGHSRSFLSPLLTPHSPSTLKTRNLKVNLLIKKIVDLSKQQDSFHK